MCSSSQSPQLINNECIMIHDSYDLLSIEILGGNAAKTKADMNRNFWHAMVRCNRAFDSQNLTTRGLIIWPVFRRVLSIQFVFISSQLTLCPDMRISLVFKESQIYSVNIWSANLWMTTSHRLWYWLQNSGSLRFAE